jgi:acyl carrier protein
MTSDVLINIIAEVLEIDPDDLDEDSGVNVTKNWDSLNQFMIMAAVEREFNAELAFDDMERVSSIKLIRDFLRKQGITEKN